MDIEPPNAKLEKAEVETADAAAFRQLVDLGIALSAESSHARLLERIVSGAMAIANADGGTLYLRTADDSLRFVIFRNDTLAIAMGGTTGRPVAYPPLRLYHDEARTQPNHNQVATHVALTGVTVNIADAYDAEGFDFSGTRTFDETTGYRSQSFLTVPLKNHKEEIIGVLQVLNALDRRTREVIPFGATIVPVLESLGSQAAVALENHQLIDEQRKLLDAVMHSARHDFLTNLPNRLMFLERLKIEIGRVRRGEENFAVLYLDLDRFKNINNILGHQMGDQILKTIAERLGQAVREIDTVARLGGDEYAVIQTGLRDPANAAILATKLLDRLRAPILLGNHEVHSDASIGIVTCSESTADEQTMLAQADLAMYKAKSEGGGRYCFHLPEMDEEVRMRAALLEDLRASIKHNELELFYQPQVDLKTGAIAGVEALVRWRYPTRGLVSPGVFIAEAERSGLILDLDRWVLLEACRRGKAWLDAGLAPPVLAVNVSSIVLKRGTQYIDVLKAALEETGYPAERLEVELTETVIMETTQAHKEVLEELKRIGVRIAIDDFGTGYSSLEYLRMFPMDRIKIAQVFVSGVPADANHIAIVDAITNLAAALHISLIAEGVETQEQLQFLKTRGCAEGQGYYFSRPVPFDEATALLRRGSFALAPE
ncbi:MAG: putative bifunctional diguanylate cyclase/phosphodiesterase [Alphaproteobacteria bacterium]